ncbi:MAG: ABC transporter permease [Bacteroidetes bacterium HGW-Bacteroidetes-13]|nr:MAG: ABC transporter permease [Bacteroidetes bacterium HGW-Bacteroidetes-13]
MKRLLLIEFQKLYLNKASRILTLIYFLLLTSIALIASIEFDFANIHFRIADQGIFNFPYIWHFNTWVAALLKLFLAIVIVSMMANEYSYRTLKQNLIDGLSKKEFVLSKFYTVLLFAAVSTVFVFVVSMILGLIFSDFNEASIIFRDLDYLLAFFVKLSGFFALCLFLGIWVKRSAFALGFLILLSIAEGILFLTIRFKSDTDFASKVMQFFPLTSMSNLIKEPFTRLSGIKSLANQVGESFNKDYSIHFYQLLIVVIWTFIFVYLSYRLLKKRDL